MTRTRASAHDDARGGDARGGDASNVERANGDVDVDVDVDGDARRVTRERWGGEFARHVERGRSRAKELAGCGCGRWIDVDGSSGWDAARERE